MPVLCSHHWTWCFCWCWFLAGCRISVKTLGRDLWPLKNSRLGSFSRAAVWIRRWRTSGTVHIIKDVFCHVWHLFTMRFWEGGSAESCKVHHLHFSDYVGFETKQEVLLETTIFSTESSSSYRRSIILLYMISITCITPKKMGIITCALFIRMHNLLFHHFNSYAIIHHASMAKDAENILFSITYLN